MKNPEKNTIFNEHPVFPQLHDFHIESRISVQFLFKLMNAIDKNYWRITSNNTIVVQIKKLFSLNPLIMLLDYS